MMYRYHSSRPLKIEQLRRLLLKQYRDLGTWEKVAQLWTTPEVPINRALVHKIAMRDFEPMKPRMRHVFNLSALIPAPACLKCGQVHVTKRCTTRPTQRRRLFDMTPEEILHALNNREEIFSNAS